MSKRFRRRMSIVRLVYLGIIIALAIVVWQFIPQDVKETVRRTYFDTSTDALSEPNSPTTP